MPVYVRTNITYRPRIFDMAIKEPCKKKEGPGDAKICDLPTQRDGCTARLGSCLPATVHFEQQTAQAVTQKAQLGQGTQFTVQRPVYQRVASRGDDKESQRPPAPWAAGREYRLKRARRGDAAKPAPETPGGCTPPRRARRAAAPSRPAPRRRRRRTHGPTPMASEVNSERSLSGVPWACVCFDLVEKGGRHAPRRPLVSDASYVTRYRPGLAAALPA